jgi:hypothetical protein
LSGEAATSEAVIVVVVVGERVMMEREVSVWSEERRSQQGMVG